MAAWLISYAGLLLHVHVSAEPAMWVIRDHDSTIYLVGTGALAAAWNRMAFSETAKALAANSELWLEIADPENEAALLPLIQRYGMDAKKPLSQKLSASGNEKLAKVAADYGVRRESLEPVQPWMVALMLTALPLQKAGYDSHAGVDWILKSEATKRG